MRHFAVIPETTVLSSQFQTLSKSARLLFIYLAVRRAGRDEWFTYPYKEMQKDTRYGTATIRESLTQLESALLMEYEHGGLLGNKNRYYLNPEALGV